MRWVDGVPWGAPYDRVPAVGAVPASGFVVGVGGGVASRRIEGVGCGRGIDSTPASSCASEARAPRRRPNSRERNPIDGSYSG